MQQQWITQVIGIVQYEFRIQWRQRGLKVIVLALLVLQVLMALTATATSNFVQVIWITTCVMLVMLMPIVVAEAIPRDRQLGVRDLLDALPLPTHTYLLGKLCGTWLSVATGIGAVWIVTGLVAWFKAGPFDVGEYVWLATAGVWTVIVLNCGLTVLAAAGQSGAMLAMLVGFFCTVMLPLTILFLNSTPTFSLTANLWDVVSPMRMLLYEVSRLPRPLVVFGTVFGRSEAVILTVGLGLLELAVLWWLATYWLRSAEARN